MTESATDRTYRDAVPDRGGRPSVLVVEDDSALSEVLGSMLAEHGVQAVAVRNARDAFRLALQLEPQALILLELSLPDGDAYTLVEWLRAVPLTQHIPVIVYSAQDLDAEDRNRLRLGPADFFTKARTNPEQVEGRILSLLGAALSEGR